MCNRTRARILKIDKDVLEAEVIAGKSIGERILIPRIPLDSKDDNASRGRRKWVPVPFTRRQFPVRPAFAMTISIDLLTRECFPCQKHLSYYLLSGPSLRLHGNESESHSTGISISNHSLIIGERLYERLFVVIASRRAPMPAR